MDNLLLLALLLTAPCFEADTKAYNECVKAKGEVGSKLDCAEPVRFQGAGLYIGRPVISIEGKEICFEVRAKYVGLEKIVTVGLSKWNENATDLYIPFTQVQRLVTNKKPEKKANVKNPKN